MDGLDTMIILFQFRDFLEEQGALKSYLKYFKTKPYRQAFYQPMDFVICGFQWENTEQGYSYWERIHLNWDKVRSITRKTYTHLEIVNILESQENSYWED